MGSVEETDKIDSNVISNDVAGLGHCPIIKSSMLVKDFFRVACIEIVRTIIRKRMIKCELMKQKVLAILSEEAKLDCDMKDDNESSKKYFIQSMIKGGRIYNAHYYKVNKNIPDFDFIYFGAAVLYKGYRSYCIRTLMINPTEVIKHNYNFLKAVQLSVVNNLRDGVELGQVYDLGVSFAKEMDENLAKHLSKCFGFIPDPEKRSDFSIEAKSKSRAVCGMPFFIAVALHGLQEGNAIYNLYITDTVIVKKGRHSEILTNIHRLPTSNVIKIRFSK